MKPIKTSKIEPSFTLVENDNKKIQIALPPYIVSEKEFDNIAAAENYIKSKPWEILINMTIALNRMTSKIENNNEQEKGDNNEKE